MGPLTKAGVSRESGNRPPTHQEVLREPLPMPAASGDIRREPWLVRQR